MVTKRVYGVGSKADVNIVSSTNASPIVVTLGSGHGFLAGEPVYITGHLTNTNANGNWRVRSITSTTITLENAGTGANVAGNGVGGATGTAGRRYATISAAETDTDNNLVTADEQIDLELCLDSPGDFDLSSASSHTFAGATTDATRYRHLKAAPGYRFSPVDLTGLRIRKPQGGTNGTALVISENYFRVTGIGIEVYENSITAFTTAANTAAVYVNANDVILDSVWAKYSGGSGSSIPYCFYNDGARPIFRNCIAAGTGDGVYGACFGFYTGSSLTAKLYNCGAWGTSSESAAQASFGFVCSSTDTIKNCIAIDCFNAVSGSKDIGVNSATCSYCISSDTSASTTPATNGYGGQPASKTWKYAAADDFRNRSTSIGIGAGDPASNTFGFTTDFTGVARGVYWDIGPYSGSVVVDTSAPTDVISSIGSGVGRDYATASDWESATKLHLISLNVRHIGELYDDSDFAQTRIEGAVTDSRCYRMLRPATGHRYDPVTDTGVYFTSTSTETIRVRENYFRMEGIGVANTSSSASRVAVKFEGRENLADGVFAQVLASTGSADAACFYGSGKADQQWRNCIARGAGAGTAGANYGFRATGDTPKLYNCVAADIDGAGGTSYGFYTVDDLAQVYNCIGSDNDIDFGSTVDPLEDYNISTDATAAGPHSITGASSAALFVSQANKDFRLLGSDSPANNAGYSLSLFFSTDLAGNDRFAPWEIGVYNGYATTPLMPAQPIGASASLCTLWLIERTDSTLLGFTDHNVEIEHSGIIYAPGAGFDQSNKRATSALRASNVEFRGAVTSDAITDDDLWARRYDGARVTERVINWRFPWATPSTVNVFYIESIQWTGEEWIANCASQASRFSQEIGRLMSRDCPYQLGDSNCKFDVRTLSQYGQAVTSIPTQRAIFRASGLSSETDEHFRFGKIVWLTGNNAGVVSEVLRYTDTNREFELQEPTPFDIQVGDDFDAIVGCSGIKDDCQAKFDNVVNFGGDPYMPGADRMIESPSR